MSDHNSYIAGPADFMVDRIDTPALQKQVESEWEVTADADPYMTSGNAAACCVKGEGGWEIHSGMVPWDDPRPRLLQIPSYWALYALRCIFPGCKVEISDGYKSVWDIPLRHKETGEVVWFGEHKGGFVFRMVETEPNESLRQSLVNLLDLLSGPVAHPYDGVQAGSIA